ILQQGTKNILSPRRGQLQSSKLRRSNHQSVQSLTRTAIIAYMNMSHVTSASIPNYSSSMCYDAKQDPGRP
ncbi:Hypothetical predicted protein, partial [Pelobates cultripes]